jgi:hypothetical protein
MRSTGIGVRPRALVSRRGSAALRNQSIAGMFGTWVCRYRMRPRSSGNLTMSWKPILATITGSVDVELRRRNEYLVPENRVPRSRLGARVALKDEERSELARLGKALGLRTLAEIASSAKPETILGWHSATHRAARCQDDEVPRCGATAGRREDCKTRRAYGAREPFVGVKSEGRSLLRSGRDPRDASALRGRERIPRERRNERERRARGGWPRRLNGKSR